MVYRTHMELLEEALKLLEDKNLVWSTDFDNIRIELAKWLRYEVSHLKATGHVNTVASLEVAGRLLNA